MTKQEQLEQDEVLDRIQAKFNRHKKIMRKNAAKIGKRFYSNNDKRKENEDNKDLSLDEVRPRGIHRVANFIDTREKASYEAKAFLSFGK